VRRPGTPPGPGRSVPCSGRSGEGGGGATARRGASLLAAARGATARRGVPLVAAGRGATAGRGVSLVAAGRGPIVRRGASLLAAARGATARRGVPLVAAGRGATAGRGVSLVAAGRGATRRPASPPFPGDRGATRRLGVRAVTAARGLAARGAEAPSRRGGGVPAEALGAGSSAAAESSHTSSAHVSTLRARLRGVVTALDVNHPLSVLAGLADGLAPKERRYAASATRPNNSVPPLPLRSILGADRGGIQRYGSCILTLLPDRSLPATPCPRPCPRTQPPAAPAFPTEFQRASCRSQDRSRDCPAARSGDSRC